MNEDIPDPETWVDQCGDYLYRYALHRLRDPIIAEDVVQETFLAGIKGLDRYDARVEVRFWLRGILRNKIVDHIRKMARELPLEDAEEYEKPGSFLMKHSGIPTRTPLPWKFDPRQAFEDQEFWQILETCTTKLPERLRLAFVLKELEGVSSEETCKVLKLSPNNLWVMIHRARKQLKSCLERNWGKWGS
jgi:RNA polymerase sigma-70 factor (TIGR02943 family)